MYIDGLPEDITNIELAEYFLKVGKVEHSVLKYDSKTSHLTGDAYVVFVNSDDAIRAVRDFSGRAFKDASLKITAISDSQSQELRTLLPGSTGRIPLTEDDLESTISDDAKLDQVIQILSTLGPDLCKKAFERMFASKQHNIAPKSDPSGMGDYLTQNAPTDRPAHKPTQFRSAAPTVLGECKPTLGLLSILPYKLQSHSFQDCLLSLVRKEQKEMSAFIDGSMR